MLSVSALRSIPLLSKLKEDELVGLRTRLKPKEVRKNAVIMRDGTAGAEMLIIVSGAVRVFQSNPKGREVTLARLASGDFFGEIALLTGYPRTANVISLTRTSLLEFSRADFAQHITRYNGLLLALAQFMADRVRMASGRLADLALLDVPHRLIRALERLADPQSQGDTLTVRSRPTHQELADLIGSSREVVSRCFKALEESGDLICEGKTVHIVKKVAAGELP